MPCAKFGRNWPNINGYGEEVKNVKRWTNTCLDYSMHF